MNINGGPHSEMDKGRMQMMEVIFSLPFQRSLFVGIFFVLLGLGVLLMLERFMVISRHVTGSSCTEILDRARQGVGLGLQ